MFFPDFIVLHLFLYYRSRKNTLGVLLTSWEDKCTLSEQKYYILFHETIQKSLFKHYWRHAREFY